MYDFHIFGVSDPCLIGLFENRLFQAAQHGGVEASDISVFSSDKDRGDWRNMKRPIAAVTFDEPSGTDLSVLEDFIKRRVPVIPVFAFGKKPKDFPEILQAINGLPYDGDQAQADRIVQAALDALGLLREQRRVFISYRRNEASGVALQLHDHLSSLGFSVFLDTHSIRPGEFFQGVLWQNLCDSDVLVMLDTRSYFKSKWTKEEFGKARSSEISILRLVWPGHSPVDETALSETMQLSTDEFDDHLALVDTVLDEVAQKTERLRARSIAARHLQITGKLKDEAKIVGASILGAGAFRAVSVRLATGKDVWVYPVIGVPTANIMNDIARKAADANQGCPFLVYDEQGLTDQWLEHLAWLNTHIPEVDFMRVSRAGSELRKRA
nr:toll/interleukin-1 receptor domain-containing protein [Stakelama sediminis]